MEEVTQNSLDTSIVEGIPLVVQYSFSPDCIPNKDADIDQDNKSIYILHGPYDLRTIGTGSVLDSWSNSHSPESWPEEPSN